MQEITLYCAILFLLVLGGWIANRWQRRQRVMHVRAVGFPLPWLPLISRGLPLYNTLPHDLRIALQEKAFFKINDLHITGTGGVDQVTDAMRVSLGGHLGLLLAHLRIAPVPSLRQVVVGPASELNAALQSLEPAWSEGTLLAEWNPAIGAPRCYREERDPSVMDHWRRLGSQSTDSDALPDDQLYFAGWAASLWHDLPEGQRAALAHAPELANEPGLFAAATEAFVRRPSSLRAVEPHLFSALKHFYLYDPSKWNRVDTRRPGDAGSRGGSLTPAAAGNA